MKRDGCALVYSQLPSKEERLPIRIRRSMSECFVMRSRAHAEAPHSRLPGRHTAPRESPSNVREDAQGLRERHAKSNSPSRSANRAAMTQRVEACASFSPPNVDQYFVLRDPPAEPVVAMD
jgi:hypothetical protein